MKFKTDLELFELMEKYFYAGALSDVLDALGYPDCAASPRAMIRPLYPEAICVVAFEPCSTLPEKRAVKTPTSSPWSLWTI